MIGQILLQLILIALNAIFACAEIAVISSNETRIDKLAEQGNKPAKRLQALQNRPAQFLATIQVAITLSGFLGSAFGAAIVKFFFIKRLHHLKSYLLNKNEYNKNECNNILP